MASCYHPQVVFSDPVFGRLNRAQALAMWQMLCGRAKDLEITFSQAHADDRAGSAYCEPHYMFGKSQRTVHNVIAARFEFQDGLMVKHTDAFNLYRWASMALGPLGVFLGWMPMVQSAIRKDARRGLNEFMQKQEG